MPDRDSFFRNRFRVHAETVTTVTFQTATGIMLLRIGDAVNQIAVADYLSHAEPMQVAAIFGINLGFNILAGSCFYSAVRTARLPLLHF